MLRRAAHVPTVVVGTVATAVGNTVESLSSRVAKLMLERTMRDGIDLRKLRFLPPSFMFAFKRDGLDPVPQLARARDEQPVKRLGTLFGRGIWLVSGYEAARDALSKGGSFSNDLRGLVSMEGREGSEQIGGLGMTDPPDHTALRRYLTPEFTRHRLARLEPFIEQVVQSRLDDMAAAGPRVDLVERFAFPVPFDVICELLGLPVEDRKAFYEIGVARFDLSEGGVGVFGAAAHSRDFLIKAVSAQRDAPGEGLIGALIREHGDDLDDLTLGGIADGVFLGGYETSASMLALGSYLLSQTPEAMQVLQGDDETVDRVVEELLRHLTVVQVAFPRFAKADMTLGGQQVKAGDVVAISLLAANRDDHLSPGAGGFDPTREPTRHLAFGHGMHRCVGAELARMELRIALRELARRFPDLAVTARPDRLGFRKMSAVYGVETLPVDLYGGADRVRRATSGVA